MGTIKTFRDLIVWQNSMDLVTQIYLASGNFPKSEFFGLISQLLRSAVSIPSNIAEGYGRRSTGDYVRFLTNFCRFSIRVTNSTGNCEKVGILNQI